MIDRSQPDTTALRQALEECIEILALVERPAFVDPDYGDEVEALGNRIGYGALMSSASASWRKRLEEEDCPTGGEFVAGPCHATVLLALNKARAALCIPHEAVSPLTVEDVYANCQTTLIGFSDELTERNIKFICDQISRKVMLALAGPSDGAIYAEVSQRSLTPKEADLMMKALRDSAELVEVLIGREGYVLVPQAALDWLDGSAPDPDGKWFGDCAPDPKDTPLRRYWWRSKFRELCTVTRAQSGGAA